MASLSSLAGLSHRLEESRARQLQERSSQALQLMRTAVEWKSWEELRTLTKAFQRYLEEIRETDLRRRRDIEANLSRVCAARDQLANVTAHKTEATEEVARLSADNVELRRQLEFDARQFVALLQSCAHLEKQLGVLRKGKERDPGKEPIAETGESEELGLQTDVKSEREVPLGATLPDPVGSDSSSKSRPLCRRAASAAGGEAASEREVASMPPSLRSGNCCTAQSASGLDASPTASLQTPDASPATVVAPGDALPAASPCSRSQTSEPMSQTKNPRLLQDLPLDALGMLQSLVAVKQHLLQLQTAQGEPAFSASDGTPARKDPTSPEHGQDDDSTSTAMDSGTSRSSGGGHAPSGCEGGGPRTMQREEQNLAKGTLPQELPGSPRPNSRPCDVASPLRPSALAAAEAARWAQVKHAQPAVPLMWEPVASEPRAATESIASQPVASSKSMLSTPTKSILTSSMSPAALPGRQPPDSTMMSPTSQVTPGHQCRGHGRVAGSPARSPVRSQVRAGQSPAPGIIQTPPDSTERLRASFKQLPAVPPLPCQSPRSPRGAPAHASPAPKYGSNRTTLQTSSPRPQDSTRSARADASYVATVQLVRELNNGNVPAATASSGPPKPYKGLPQKEVQKLIVERAKRREAPMSRHEGEAPARTNSKRRERAERGGRGAASSASNTKASL
ncbi:GONST4 [Symbiodinium sp. CCMP2592]|nr:GONST4 [Symbiodinium sp. CCMP2592]